MQKIALTGTNCGPTVLMRSARKIWSKLKTSPMDFNVAIPPGSSTRTQIKQRRRIILGIGIGELDAQILRKSLQQNFWLNKLCNSE